jgi:outer membrane autotransporter protein
MPTVGLSWQHEFLDYGQNISGSFDNGNGPGFTFASMDGARNQAFGTAGISAQLGQHFGGYVYYNPIFGSKQVSSQGIVAGLNYSF